MFCTSFVNLILKYFTLCGNTRNFPNFIFKFTDENDQVTLSSDEINLRRKQKVL